MKCCNIHSHTNLRYLTPPEKDERIRNLHTQVIKDRKRINQLQSRLHKMIQLDEVKVDDNKQGSDQYYAIFRYWH